MNGDYQVLSNEAASALTQTKQASSTQEVEAQLLDGQFSSQQARAHVLGILGKSIQHHWVQSFKHLENSDQLDVYSDLKMAELYKLRNEFQQMLEQAENNGLILDIKASLKVSFVSNNASDKMAS